MNAVLDVEIALRSWLLQQAEVTALVSQRIHPDAIPQGGTFPCIVQDEMDGDDLETINGQSSLSQARLTVSACAATAKQARQLRNLVGNALKRSSRQRLRTDTGGDVFINGIEVVSKDGDYTPPDDGSEGAYYFRAIEVLVTYSAYPA